MDSTDDIHGPLITLPLPLNWSAPLSPPPTTVVSPLEIISPKPKRLIPDLSAYLEDSSDDEDEEAETEEDDILLSRTESPEPMPEFKASSHSSIPSHPIQFNPPFHIISNRIAHFRRLLYGPRSPNHKYTRHPHPRRPTHHQRPQTSPPSPQTHSIGYPPSRLPCMNTPILAPHSRNPGHSMMTGTRSTIPPTTNTSTFFLFIASRI